MNLKTLLITALAFAAPLTLAQSAESAKPAAAAAPATKAHELSRQEFEQLLAKPDKLLVIDVRRPDEISKVGGFPVYLSVQPGELEKSLAWIPKDRTIVTVSNHAARSGRAALLLASKGFKVAGTVGAQTFEQQGGHLAKVEVPAPK